MVFDWFQRRSVQPQPAAETAAQEEAPPQETAPSEPSSEDIVAEDSQLSSPPPPPEPAPAGIDADALAWAREAYARLKAEQQAARPVESAVQAPPAPPPPPEAAPTEPPQISQSPETAGQEAPPSTPAPSSFSLLERAAAERSQRRVGEGGATALGLGQPDLGTEGRPPVAPRRDHGRSQRRRDPQPKAIEPVSLVHALPSPPRRRGPRAGKRLRARRRRSLTAIPAEKKRGRIAPAPLESGGPPRGAT